LDEGGGAEAGDVSTDEPGDKDATVADAVSEGIDLVDAPPIDATSEKPFVNEAGCFCDCDRDGYRAKEQDAAACDAAVSKTQIDCDDLDVRANPDAGYVADLPTLDTKGDWNCDGKYTLEWQLSLKCSDYSTSLGTGCGKNQGFQAAEVNCGQESVTWVQCQDPGAVGACTTGTAAKQVQRCK
jgi:hypothetical protein